MLNTEIIARWPGKSANDVGPEHPAIYHMLDVAAVAERLLSDVDLLPAEKQALVFLTAVHDLGKLSDSFRDMLRDGQRQAYRHWELTEIHLDANEGSLNEILKPYRPGRLLPLFGASAGHHGRPSKLTSDQRARAGTLMGPQAKDDARLVIEAFAELWPDASLVHLKDRDLKRLSWWLSGLVTTADWIGSNTHWFEPMTAGPSVSDYMQIAREKAQRAVKEAGLMVPALSGVSVFDWPELRPMQAACQSVALQEGPVLALIEDETGAGKTEAALMLAQRMLEAQKGAGLFFALPTMATADAMFTRVSNSIGRIFSSEPTITLAHGRASLSADYRDIVLGAPNAPEDVGCTEWLNDSRRRALLATVGVGTIDQALLSVLPVKFQTLRHYGLSSKILIVDEVHEMGEAYVAETLVQLLTAHRAAGGSAILLTATLPLHLRRKLLATYNGVDDGNPAYPALTIAAGAECRAFPQDTSSKGPVRVERLATAEAALDLIAKSAQDGAACVWVRNAVDDAIAAVEALRARGVSADLLHARYALGDRKRIEADIRKRFGKTGEGRAGGVLVGTQVLESSLDLDFDVMVSDLAPMAGLVQRVGRLWRHMDLRPAAGRPVAEPVLYVVSPDPDEVRSDRWLHDVLDRGAWVYSADIMWRTARHLFQVGQIVAPSGIRALIEASEDEAIAVPAVLEKFELERLGKSASHASLAWQNVVDLKAGYRSGGQANDDASYPTRLGPEQVTLVLCKAQGNRLVPLFDGPDGWAMSEVSVSRSRVEKIELTNNPETLEAAGLSDWPQWKQSSHILCPLSEGKVADGLGYEASSGLMFY
ncbi:CRISPR-associated helicase Cas3' [Donghicola tyrosinivorans]|nr:CRISPR-associated helicase Cas3' [Donghicola tyrosinivorans]